MNKTGNNVVIGIAIVVAALVLGGALLFRITPSQAPDSEIENVSTQRAQLTALKSADRDTDNDGLRDWEEVLWGTDPQNADTDGDGTTDNDEILQGRNPTAPGPNDQLTSVNNVFFSIDSVELDSDGLALGEELFSGYVELKRTNQLSASSMNAFAASLINEATQDLVLDPFERSDITQVSDSPQTVQTYRGGIEVTLGRFTTVTENEMITVTKAIRDDSPAAHAELNRVLSVYDAAISDLLGMRVPRSAVNLHLDLLNGLFFFRHSLDGMRNVNDDPIRAYVSNTTSLEAQELMIDAIININDYLYE